MKLSGTAKLALVVVVALFALTVLVAWSQYELSPTRQYYAPDGSLRLHGTVDGALLKFLMNGPQVGTTMTERIVLLSDGHPTAAFHTYDLSVKGNVREASPSPSIDWWGWTAPAASAVGYVADAFSYVLHDSAQRVSSFFLMDAQAAGCTGTGNCYWKSAGDANWDTTADWCSATNGGGVCGGLPAATDVVNFDASSGGHKTTLVADTTVGGVVMTGFTGTLDTSAAGHYKFTDNGAWTAPAGVTLNFNASTIVLNGTTNWNGITLNAGTSTVQFSTSLTFTPSGGLALYDVLIDATKNVTTATNTFNWNDVLTVNGTLTLGAPGAVCRDSTGVSAPLVLGASGSVTSGYAPITWGAVAGTLIIIPAGTYTGIAFQFQPTVIVAGQGFEFRLGGDTTLTEIDFRPSASAPFFMNSQTHNVSVTAAASAIIDLTLGNPGAGGYGIKATSGTWTVAGSVIINDGANSAKFYMQLGSTNWTVSGAWDNSSTTDSADWQVGTSTFTFNSTSGQTMKFANLGAAEFNNVTFNSGASTVSYTMSTNGLHWSGAMDVAGGAAVTTLATANLALTGGSATIGNAGVLTANASTVSVSGVTMTGGSTGTITVTTGAWSISGDWDTHGVGSTFSGGTTAVYTFTADANITLLSTQQTFPNLTVSGGTSLLRSAVTVTTLISVTGGTLALGSQTVTGAALTYNGGSGTAATPSVTLSGALTVSNAASSVALGSGATWVVASLSISNGNLGMTSGTFHSTGDVSISAAAAYMTLGSATWTIDGSWTNSSTSASWNPGTSTVVFDAVVAKNITPGAVAAREFYNVTFNSGANTVTFTLATRALDWNGALTIQGGAGVTTLATANLTLLGGTITVGNAGVLTANASSITSGNVTMTAGASGTITLTTASWSVTGTWDTSGVGSTFTKGTSTVTLNGIGAVKLLAGQSFAALMLNGSATVNAQSQITADSLTITGEELSMAAQTLTVNGNVLLQASGDIRATSAAVHVTGNLNVSDATSYLIMGSATWTVDGTWSNASTSVSWSSGTSTVVLTDAVGGTVTTSASLVAAEFYNLTLNSTGVVAETFTLANKLVVANTLSVADSASTTTLDVAAGNKPITAKNVTVAVGGILKLRAATVTVSGNWTDTSGATWSAWTGAVAFSGATAQTIAAAAVNGFPVMTLSGAGSKDFTTSFKTNANVTQSASAGTWKIDHGVTWTIGSGTTIKSGAAVQWDGTAASAIVITSSGNWNFDTSGRTALPVSYVTVDHSQVVGAGGGGNQVYDCGGTDAGHNVGWVINTGTACTVSTIINTSNALATMIAIVMVFLIMFGAVLTIVFYSFRQADRAAGHGKSKGKGDE